MNANPKPRDLGMAVGIRGADGSIRRRQEDEETAGGKEAEYDIYVLACNIGVRHTCCTFPACARTLHPLSFFFRAQVSVRESARMNMLTRVSFKHSINSYWVTSRQTPELAWLQVRPRSVVASSSGRSADGQWAVGKWRAARKRDQRRSRQRELRAERDC